VVQRVEGGIEKGNIREDQVAAWKEMTGRQGRGGEVLIRSVREMHRSALCGFAIGGVEYSTYVLATRDRAHVECAGLYQQIGGYRQEIGT
jgi:hypothetical protein